MSLRSVSESVAASAQAAEPEPVRESASARESVAASSHGAQPEPVAVRQAGVKAAVVVEPVAVVGVAGRFPGAETLEQFWDNLVGGVESVRRFSPEEVSQAGGQVGDGMVAVSGVLDHVESFDAKFFGLSDREAELMEPAQRLFLEVCHQALEHGGYAGTSSRVGVFAGSGMNLYNRQHQSRDSLATRVAYRLGLTGPAIGVQSAWSSSLVAVHLACQALRSGDADLALAGAAAVQMPQATSYHPGPESILSPSGKVRAFAADADGTVGGNGVAAVLLKRLDQAIADGDTVYAVIRGTAVSNEDAPAGNQVELIERALERAGFRGGLAQLHRGQRDRQHHRRLRRSQGPHDRAAPAHRQGRLLHDRLGEAEHRPPRQRRGHGRPDQDHPDAAAPDAGPDDQLHRAEPGARPRRQPVRDRHRRTRLGGRYDVARGRQRPRRRRHPRARDPGGGPAADPPWRRRPRRTAALRPDPDALADLVELYRTDLGHGTGHRLIDLAGTAALGRPAHRHRIAVAGSSEAELVDALGSAQAAEVPRGGPGPLGYAFTGQGAARRGMAAGLAARFPAFRSVLDECDRVYHEETGGSLLELLLTPAGTSEGVWPTETAQPALFAFELALARLWQSFGVQPALVVGHSVGEYAALCVAGALSLADGVRLTAKRGQLMQRGTVPGAMVAVRADADRVRELAQTTGVEVAAGNGPQSFVLTGSEVIVGQLAAQLDRLEVAWQRLDVDRAFHSSLVDPILADFAEIVREITLKPLRTPMVSSWSGDLLESGTVLDGDYLVGQLRQPVLFGDAVEAVTAAGCRRFLELGPDAVLSPAGRRIAPNSTWIPAQRLGQDPVLATMNGLAELYEQGTEIAWSKVYPDGGRVPLPTYPFRRVHHPVDASVTVVAGTTSAGDASTGGARVQPNAFERAARAQMVFAPPSSAAVKRIPLDPPDESAPAEVEPVDEVAERSPFALPAETHQIDADYLAQAGSLSGDEVSAERYRDALNAVLDLTCAELRLDPYDLTVDHTFAELGATPASMAPVINQINTRFTVELTPDELFATYTTPHKLATAVAIHTANVAEGTESTEAEGTESVSGSAEPTDVAAEAEDGTPSEAAAQSDDGAAEAAGVRVEGGAAAGTVVRAEGGVAGERAAQVEDGGAEAAASRIEDGAEDRAASQAVDGAEDRAGLKAEDGAAADEAVGEVDAGSAAEAGLQTPAEPAEQALSTAEVAGRTTNGPVAEAEAAAEADAEAGAGSVAETVAAMEADAEVAAGSVVGAGAAGVVADAAVGDGARGEAGARDPRAALAVLGSGLAELAAKVDEAAAATSEAELPGSGMAALMSQQLRVAGQLVDGVTKLMREQLALLTPEVAEDIDTDVTSTEPVAPLVDAGDAASAANNPGDAAFTADEPGDAGSTAGKPGEDTSDAGRTGEGASADEAGVSPESEPAADESAVPATELSGDEAVVAATELAVESPAKVRPPPWSGEAVVRPPSPSVRREFEASGDEARRVGGRRGRRGGGRRWSGADERGVRARGWADHRRARRGEWGRGWRSGGSGCRRGCG